MAPEQYVITLDVVTSRSAASLRRTADGQILGVLLLVVGGGWLLREVGVAVLWPTLLSVALIALGLGMVVTSHLRGTKWLTATGVLLAVILAATSSISLDMRLLRGGFGSELLTVSSVEDLQPSYSLGIGELIVDLSALDLEGAERVRARLGIGELVVIVPADAAISVTADVEAGSATVVDFVSRSEFDIPNRYEEPGFDEAPKRLILDLDVGVGSIEVQRAAP